MQVSMVFWCQLNEKAGAQPCTKWGTLGGARVRPTLPFSSQHQHIITNAILPYVSPLITSNLRYRKYAKTAISAAALASAGFDHDVGRVPTQKQTPRETAFLCTFGLTCGAWVPKEPQRLMGKVLILAL